MLFQLTDDIIFPNPELAEDDGLLAIGGDLSIERLLTAYYNGIFPWFSEDDPILWYSPPQRFVLYPQKIRISKSMKKIIKENIFQITINKAFPEVITNCAKSKRKEQDGTWITGEMQQAYIDLHKAGFAYSVEAWQNKKLVGGLYGLLINGVFCGESMFSEVSNASKAALIWLVQNLELRLVDCQVYTQHLESLGAELIDRKDFLEILQK